jgi:hypothetical protein
MEVLSLGLVLGSGVAAIGGAIAGVDFFKRKLFGIYRKWDKLKLDKYKIKKYYIDEKSIIIIVEVAVGGSVSDLKGYIGKIEKAYSCKCEIEDIEFSKYIDVGLNYNDSEDNSEKN